MAVVLRSLRLHGLDHDYFRCTDVQKQIKEYGRAGYNDLKRACKHICEKREWDCDQHVLCKVHEEAQDNVKRVFVSSIILREWCAGKLSIKLDSEIKSAAEKLWRIDLKQPTFVPKNRVKPRKKRKRDQAAFGLTESSDEAAVALPQFTPLDLKGVDDNVVSQPARGPFSGIDDSFGGFESGDPDFDELREFDFGNTPSTYPAKSGCTTQKSPMTPFLGPGVIEQKVLMEYSDEAQLSTLCKQQQTIIQEQEKLIQQQAEEIKHLLAQLAAKPEGAFATV